MPIYAKVQISVCPTLEQFRSILSFAGQILNVKSFCLLNFSVAKK